MEKTVAVVAKKTPIVWLKTLVEKTIQAVALGFGLLMMLIPFMLGLGLFLLAARFLGWALGLWR